MRLLHYFLTFCFWVLSINFTFAQKRNAPKSQITFYTLDEYPIHVRINHKVYNQFAQEITVGNIPGKKPYIEIYSVKINNQGQQYLKKLYSGSIKILPGGQYYIEVIPGQRSLHVQSSRHTITKKAPKDITSQQTLTPEYISDQRLRGLIERMEQQSSDEKKLEEVIVLGEQWTISDMVIIMNHLLFDENRLKFLKTQDLTQLSSSQIQMLQSTFTSNEAKEVLNQN